MPLNFSAALFSTTGFPLIQLYSLLSPTPSFPSTPDILPFFLPFLSCRASLPPTRTAMTSGSTLTLPSARAQTNLSRVVLFHKDQKQLVSFHVSRFSPCLPVPPTLSTCLSACLTAHNSTLLEHVCACLSCLSRALIVVPLICMTEILLVHWRFRRTLGFLHVCSQNRFLRLLHQSVSHKTCSAPASSGFYVLHNDSFA